MAALSLQRGSCVSRPRFGRKTIIFFPPSCSRFTVAWRARKEGLEASADGRRLRTLKCFPGSQRGFVSVGTRVFGGCSRLAQLAGCSRLGGGRDLFRGLQDFLGRGWLDSGFIVNQLSYSSCMHKEIVEPRRPLLA